MTTILKFNEYMDCEQIAIDFLRDLNNGIISESQENHVDTNSLIKGILSRLGFNLELALTFGTGVKMMYPIVDNLINNMKLEIKPTKEDIVLLCITVLSVMFLHNKKNPPISSDDIKNKLIDYISRIMIEIKNKRSYSI